MSERPYLLISDTQAIYHHPQALSFCAYVKRHYSIPDENVIHQGDELDLANASMHPKNPEAEHTPKGEIRLAQEWVREWSSVFPKMMVCISNHGLRWVRKASAAEIPSMVLQDYKQLYRIPDGWQYKEEWRINTKHPFRAIHGLGYSGQNGHRMAAIDAGMSTSIGHLHSHAGIAYVRTNGLNLWAMNTGCLIDQEAWAFDYGKWNRFKPCLGVGVVFDQGSTPVWLPLK